MEGLTSGQRELTVSYKDSSAGLMLLVVSVGSKYVSQRCIQD